MRTLAICVAVAITSGALGYLAGRQSLPPVEPTAVAANVPAVSPRGRAKLGRMVCAAVQPSEHGEEQLDALRLRAKWCESELAEANRARDEVRQPWPTDEDSPEAPDLWAEAVEEALAECDADAAIELVDCTEYPCAAALRPATPSPSAEAHKAEMERLMGVVRACPGLRDSFNLADDQVARGLDVYRLDAPCGGTREDFFVLTALEPTGPAYELLQTDRNDKEDRDFNRWLYRRADDIAAMWPCTDE